MHETVFANRIREEAGKEGAVRGITVEVGELAHIPARELKEALERLVGWDLEIIEKRAKVRCPCGFEGHPKILEKGHDYTLFQCPRCNSIPVVMEGGDVILKEVRCV